MKLFDVHTHVQFAGFENDWKEVIDRSLENGVYLMNVGTQKDTSAKAVKIANMYEKGVYASVGLHPVHTAKSFHDAAELGPPSPEATEGQAVEFTPKGFMSRAEEFDYDYYANLAKDPKVLAIGECGLDYYRREDIGNSGQDTVKQKQEEAFRLQADLALEFDKALMLHVRPSVAKAMEDKPRVGTDDAYEDIFGILAEEKYGGLRKILHFYVGSKEMTEKFVSAGYCFSLGGVNTFTTDYHESIKAMPVDRILLETDAPYVAPEPYRGKRNEPVYMVETAKRLADVVGMGYDDFVKQTIRNTKEVLKVDF